MHTKLSVSILGAFTLLLVLSGCGNSSADATPNDESGDNAGSNVLRLASTTSTRDSGLFDVLLPAFEEEQSCRVDLVAVGTGAALKLGEAGDVDTVVVHARSAEEAFMQAGHGIRHEPVMHNFFLLVGPADDPAGIKNISAAEALQSIAGQQQRFVSRGDDSGTHKREQAIWNLSGGRPEWDNYIESGQGMGATVVMADEMMAYALIDEGTWLKQRSKFDLVPLVSGADELRNPYGVIVVNPDKHPGINSELASAFADFLISPRAQKLIAGYLIDGRQLFHPDRVTTESEE